MADGALQAVIIADDLTGAMDAAAPFARRGLSTRVLTGPGRLDDLAGNWPDVLSINTVTRHLPREQAAAVVETLVEALAPLQPRLLFKKIDSTLRGNLVAETLAAMRASGCREMLVCPAVPSQGRSLAGGVLYINGVPLHETAIGQDRRGAPPGASLPELYRKALRNTAIRLEAQATWQAAAGREMLPRVAIVDAETSDQLSAIAAAAWHSRGQILFVGAAGLSEALAEAMCGAPGPQRPPDSRPGKVLFVVGSRTREAATQMASLVGAHPDTRVTGVDDFPPGGESRGAAPSTAGNAAIVLLRAPSEGVTSQQADPEEVAASLAADTAQLLADSPTSLLVITGGDTALAVLNRLGVASIHVCGEVVPGVVHGQLATQHGQLNLVTKAGGFGDHRLFNTILNFFRQDPVRREDTGRRHP